MSACVIQLSNGSAMLPCNERRIKAFCGKKIATCADWRNNSISLNLKTIKNSISFAGPHTILKHHAFLLIAKMAMFHLIEMITWENFKKGS